MKPLILLTVLTICVSACKRYQTDNIPANECSPSSQIPPGYMLNTLAAINHDSSHCGYMFLGKMNYWVYADSLFDANGQFLQTVSDTLRFTGTYQSGDSLIWWKPNSFKGFMTYNYSTGNVLYTLGNRWGYGPSVEWAYPITADSAEYNCVYTDYPTLCKAWKLNDPVVVAAGSFTNCFRYVKIGFLPWDIEIYFKPGVGILKCRLYTNNTGTTTLYKTSTLLSYHIE